MHRPRPNAALKTRSHGAKNHAASNRTVKRNVLKTIRLARKTPVSRSAARKWTRRVSTTSSAAGSRVSAMAGAALPILRVRKIAVVATNPPARVLIVRR